MALHEEMTRNCVGCVLSGYPHFETCPKSDYAQGQALYVAIVDLVNKLEPVSDRLPHEVRVALEKVKELAK